MHPCTISALQRHLANGGARRPIDAIHEVPMQPGWASFLVHWTDQQQPSLSPNGYVFKVALLDGCPYEGYRFTGKGKAGLPYEPEFSSFTGDRPDVYANESDAVARFGALITSYGRDTAREYDLPTDAPRSALLQ